MGYGTVRFLGQYILPGAVVNNRQFNVQCSTFNISEVIHNSQLALIHMSVVVNGAERSDRPMAERYCNQSKKSRAHYVSNIATSSVLLTPCPAHCATSTLLRAACKVVPIAGLKKNKKN